MFRHLALAVLGLFGDAGYLRVYALIVAGFGMSALMYCLWLPLDAPLWPAAVTVSLFTVIGLFWERQAYRQRAPLHPMSAARSKRSTKP